MKRSIGETTFLVQLVLSSAFDTVEIATLQSDLRNIGVTESVFSRFTSYPKHRRFQILVNQEMGMPQGRILAPILFTIYTVEVQYLLEEVGVSFQFYGNYIQIYVTMNDLS